MNTEISELGIGATTGVATFAVIEGGADRCVSSGGDEAELIAQCTAFTANRAALNIYMGELDGQDNIFWHRYVRAFDAIGSIPATTLVGLLAKAEATIAEGTQPDGSVDYEAGWAPALIQDLMGDMHAMLREAAPASMPFGGAARQILAMGGDPYLDALRAAQAANRAALVCHDDAGD